MVWQIVLQLVLIGLNAVFACAEIAVISINDAKLDKMAATGEKKAVRLKKLTSRPASFLATIQVAITFAGFIGSAFAADHFAEHLMKLIQKTGLSISEQVLRPISVVIITLILSYLTLVFGELVPKRVGMKNSEKLALALSGLVRGVQVIFAPLVWLLNASTNCVLRLLGIDPNADDSTVTEEEILMMSDAGVEKGTVGEDEHRVIKNIFSFDDTTIGQICTHRTDVDALWDEDTSAQWEETILKTRHSYYPICSDRIDNVIGVLCVKDYLGLKDKARENIKLAIREPYFVPENMKADDLFSEMKQNRRKGHFAIVIDEYGGMCGVITVIDLVEQIVGDFDGDATEESEPAFLKIGENCWEIPGIMSLNEIAEELDIKLPANEFETFNGYLLSLLGEIPKDGTSSELDTDTLHIEILRIVHHRIELCKVTKKTVAEPALS